MTEAVSKANLAPMLNMQGLLLFELSQVAAGYWLCNEACKNPEFEIIEAAFSVGGKFILLIQGPPEQLEKFSKQQQVSIFDSVLLTKNPNPVLQAYAHLSQNSFSEAVAIMTATSLSTIFWIADLACADSQIQLAGIHPPREMLDQALLFLTGKKTAISNFVSSLRKTSTNRKFDLLEIESQKRFLEFFNLDNHK